MINRYLINLFCLLLCFQISYSQESTDRIFSKSATREVAINSSAFTSKSSKVKFSIDLGEYGSYNLDLEKNQLFSEAYLANNSNKTASYTNLPTLLKGIVEGKPKTKVSLTTNEGFLSGFIDLGDEVIYFEPYKTFKKSASEDELIIYYQRDVIDQGHSCAANDSHQQKEHIVQKAPKQKSVATGCYVVDIVLVADYGMYVKHGNNPLNHIISVLNNVSNNFDNEFNDPISFSIVDDYIATNPSLDLWTATNDANVLLNEFSNSNFTSVTFDLASLWVSRDIQRFSNFSTVGIAHKPGICQIGKKYNLIEDYSSVSDLNVLLAHEIGHNFNARHDPSGSGTIMAPSVNITTAWSQNSQDVINDFYPNATCLCASNNFIDLQIYEDFCGNSFTSNGLNFYSAKVINTGDITTSQSSVGLFLSFDDEVNSNDILIADRIYSSFAPGISDISVGFDIMSTGLPGGVYYLGFVADIHNQVSEIEENNNARVCSTKITIPSVCQTGSPPNADVKIFHQTGGGLGAAGCGTHVECLFVFDPNPTDIYAWSTGNPDLINCNLIGNGTYAVTVTNVNGCQSMGSIDLSNYVKPSPIMNIICPQQACINQPVTLQLNATNGTPPYQYSFDGGNTFSSINTHTITPTNTGVFCFSNFSVRDSENCTPEDTGSCCFNVNGC